MTFSIPENAVKYNRSLSNESETAMSILIHGDAHEALRAMPGGSANQVLTSPPYWMQRDYQVIGQIGREATVQQYLQRLWAVFDEGRRVLRPEGTCFVNLGDKYVGKRRLMIPERFAIGMDERVDPSKLHRLAQAQSEARKHPVAIPARLGGRVLLRQVREALLRTAVRAVFPVVDRAVYPVCEERRTVRRGPPQTRSGERARPR